MDSTFSGNSKIVVCISGKRKSGKDFVSSKLCEALVSEFTVSKCSISHSLKDEFARKHGLDFDRLMGEDGYKEIYRQKMVEYGEDIRSSCLSYFCRKSLENPVCEIVKQGSVGKIIIVTDCRRLSDLDFFIQHFGRSSVLLFRVEATIHSRKNRGFQFIEGIDDKETECALDEFKNWDVIIRNDDEPNINFAINVIYNRIFQRPSCFKC